MKLQDIFINKKTGQQNDAIGLIKVTKHQSGGYLITNEGNDTDGKQTVYDLLLKKGYPVRKATPYNTKGEKLPIRDSFDIFDYWATVADTNEQTAQKIHDEWLFGK